MMKLHLGLVITLAVMLTLSSIVNAQNKVIYGEDNRVDVIDSVNSVYAKLALSTAGRVSKTKLYYSGEMVELLGSSLSSRGYCAEDRFSNQNAVADCSGFLVGEDLLVTAGHCMKSKAECNNYKWVFDYKIDSSGNVKELLRSSVYSCVEIVEQKLDDITKNDYALIRLNRVVTDRVPLKFRKTGKISNNQALVIIGHPSGLPTKIADGANVRTNMDEFYFRANLDSFGGNSGSAVFNADTGEVEGILVRGERDHVYDIEHGCYKVNTCENDECRGEDVTRITEIKALK